MTLVRFSTKRRVLDRLGLTAGDRLAELGIELRRIDASIEGLAGPQENRAQGVPQGAAEDGPDPSGRLSGCPAC